MSSDSDPDSDLPSSGNPDFLILMIVALLAVWGLVTDALHTGDGGSIDLRNRITAVRVAAEQHHDPYTYKWNRADGERFQDPFNSASSPYMQTTVTPVTLAAFLPFKDLNYRLTQWLWLLLEYACLSLGFFAWTRSAAREHWIWGAVLTCLYCLTPHWRLHVDRGQSHVIYAALLLCMLWAGQVSGKRGSWLEAFLGSMLTLMRPTFGLLLGLSAGRRKVLAVVAAASGLLLWALLPVLMAGSAIWRQYFQAMSVQSRLYLDHVPNPPARFAATDVIEGIPIEQFLNIPRIPFSDTSIYKLVSFQLPPNLLLGLWALLAGLAGLLLIRRGETGSPRFWWALSAWIYLGDFLLPAYRYSYNHILLWPVLLLGLSACTGRARTLWLTLCPLLLVLHTATWWLPNSFIPWPGVASLFLALGVVVRTLFPEGENTPQPWPGSPSPAV